MKKTILVGLIATVSLSAFAQVAVKPKPVTVKPGTAIEVKPGTTPKVETTLQGQQGLSLDAFKAGQIGAATAVVNEQALNELNAQEQCGSAYVANEFVKRAPKLNAQEIKLAVDSGNLRPGNCGEGSILSVQNPQVIENVGQTTSCLTRAGGQASLKGAQLDNVGGDCLYQAKQDDADVVPSTVAAEVENYKAVAKCDWWPTSATVH